jgi:hypothetical protein
MSPSPFCRTCQRHFATQSSLDDHDRTTHNFHCEGCVRIFRTLDGLSMHNTAVHTLPCSSCKKTFRSTKALEAHNDKAHRWRCEECDRTFKECVARDAHFKSSLAHNIICPSCKMLFKSQAVFQKHQLAAHETQCQRCEKKKTVDTKVLEHHTKNVHCIACQHCAMTFCTHEALQTHSLESHRFECSKCSLTFPTRPALQEHHDEAHVFGYSTCLQNFDNGGDRSEHVKSMHSIECNKHTEPMLSGAPLILHEKQPTKQETITVSSFQTSNQVFTVHEELGYDENVLDIFSSSGPFDSSPNQLDHFGLMHDTRRVEEIVTLVETSGIEMMGLSSLETTKSDSSTDCSISRPSLGLPAVTLRCPSCTHQPDDLQTFLEHYHFVHMFNCFDCGATFDNTTLLENHEASTHLSKVPKFDPDTGNKISGSYSPDFSLSNLPPAYQLAEIEARQTGTQTTLYPCGECAAVLESEQEFEIHMKHSPFHGKEALSCIECMLHFPNQIKLLQHLDSKLHRTKWVLVMV